MLQAEECLICGSAECRAEFVVKKKPPIGKGNLRCACGNDLKKAYNPPVLTIYGTLPEMSQLNVEIPKKLGLQTQLHDSTAS